MQPTPTTSAGVAPDGSSPAPAGDTASASFDALLPPAMARKAEAVGVAKAALPTLRLFVLGVLAGAFIAFGAMFATVVTAGTADQVAYGPARLLAGLVFSLGLVLVVVGGAELFTGNNLLVMALVSKRVSARAVLRNWGIVYVGNFAGAVGVAALTYGSGHYRNGAGAVGRQALEIGAAKTSLAFGEAILLGVLANVLVCLAVWMCMSARSVTDKVVAIVLPISAFVAAGFEHSIANMYFVPIALFVKAGAPDGFWAEIRTSAGRYDDLTWGGFLVGNLLPVTIGNMIGGAPLVGLVYAFVYRAAPAEPRGPAAGRV